MKTTLRYWIMVGVLAFVLLAVPAMLPAASAAPAAQAEGGGLMVSNAILRLAPNPGDVYVHEMVVSNGSEAPPVDVTVEARGFGQSLVGQYLPLTPEEDLSPYSARTFITDIDQTSFHLEPGESLPVSATLTIPQDISMDSHYALVYFHSEPVDQGGGVSRVIAISVPILIHPKGMQEDLSAEISDVIVEPVESGKPIVIQTIVKNTGNHHFKVKGEAVIRDAGGAEITRLVMPVLGTSTMPTFSQQLEATYVPLERADGLPVGTYSVEVTVTREDDSLVGAAETTFEVLEPYDPLPGIPAESRLVVFFEDEIPAEIDAFLQADIKVQFMETGPVTGMVAIGKYPAEPEGAPRFADQLGDGGTGGQGVKFVTVFVSGFEQGRAQITARYKTAELGDMDPSSLFLAYKDGNVWRKLDNLEVQTGAEIVRGELPVAVLTERPMIALGGGGIEASALQAGFFSSLVDLITSNPLVIAVAVLVVLGLVVLFIFLRPRRSA